MAFCAAFLETGTENVPLSAPIPSLDFPWETRE
jgi:hypothetical protein